MVQVIVSSFHRFIENQCNDQLSVGLSSRLVEHCTVIAACYGFKSCTGLNFFFRPYFYYCLSSVHYCKDHSHINKKPCGEVHCAKQMIFS